MKRPRTPWMVYLLAAATILLLSSSFADDQGKLPVLPDIDSQRVERLDASGQRFRTPEGFKVEEVAGNKALGSLVNMTFDWRGRPLVATEGDGLKILEDRDGDGRFETILDFTPPKKEGTHEPGTVEADTIETAHGLYVLGAGDVLAHANGPEEGTALYRIRDDDGDDRADRIDLVMKTRGRIQDHGPHTITRGPDGLLYILFGNMARPDIEPAPTSPLRQLEEDQLLPPLLDPRGHANDLTAPGGTVWRVDLDSNRWELYLGGLRNPFDMAFSPNGELFIYEADMEWDRGLPWFRPTRVVHGIPAADFGWRTGSGKIAFELIDTLPSVVDTGRGSPVGVAFYRHDVYPEALHDALFMGDWSRGRIRVMFPERAGASYTGAVHDFVLGEPLNVTDLDVGPDGLLYFTTGGRQTSGGLYRVSYSGASGAAARSVPGGKVEDILNQPMPRSAWGRQRIAENLGQLGDASATTLRRVIDDGGRASKQRVLALELLWLEQGASGVSVAQLATWLGDQDGGLRALAARLLGLFDFEDVEGVLAEALGDGDPFVVRRSIESLVQSGMDLERSGNGKIEPSTVERLFELLNHDDRHVRWAAREAISDLDHGYWIDPLMLSSPEASPRGFFESILAVVYRPQYDNEFKFLYQKMNQALRSDLDDEGLLRFARVLELLLIRDKAPDKKEQARATFGEPLLELYPHKDPRIHRSLERLVAYLAMPGSIRAMLDHLESESLTPEQQIDTIYALRTMKEDWSEEQQSRLLAWFDRGRRIRGAASMRGYVDLLWEDALALLDEAHRQEAEARKIAYEQEQAALYSALVDPSPTGTRKLRRRLNKQGSKAKRAQARPSDSLSQMSFEELSEFLEYDITAYEKYSVEEGELVFHRARCSSCHVFGDIGNGGGPDLSTVVKRLRRSEILESIMEPSKVVSDQYTALDIELQDGGFVSGMVVGDTERQYTLITSSGDRKKVKKSQIRSAEPASVSIMPEGLLDTMELRDLGSLMRFLDAAAEE